LAKATYMPQRLLDENWSDYENKKRRGTDPFFFSCEDEWEMVYLLNKVRKYFPFETDTTIRRAIESTCREIPRPRPRDKFVTTVFSKLRYSGRN